MDSKIEIERARIGLHGCSPERAERVSRMIFDHLQAMLSSDCVNGGTPRVIASLQVPSLEVEWELMDDDTIARTGAAWIHRWLRVAY